MITPHIQSRSLVISPDEMHGCHPGSPYAALLEVATPLEAMLPPA
jgi:hypothetical protein